MFKSQGPRLTDQGTGNTSEKAQGGGAADTLPGSSPLTLAFYCKRKQTLNKMCSVREGVSCGGCFSPSTIWSPSIKTKSPGWGQVLYLLSPCRVPVPATPLVNMTSSFSFKT